MVYTWVDAIKDISKKLNDKKPDKKDVRLKNTLIGIEDIDEQFISAIQGGEGANFTLLSIPKKNSVTIGKMSEDFESLGGYSENIQPSEIKNGWFDLSKNTYFDLANWNLYFYDVVEGEKYKYTCYTWENNSGGLILFNENNEVISYLYKGIGKEEVHEGTIEIPSQCVKMALFGRLKTPSAIKFICHDFSSIKSICEKNNITIENNLKYYDLDVTFQNGYYNKNTNVLYTTPNYDMQYVDINVKEGEQFKITCGVNEKIVSCIMFKDSNGHIVSTLLDGDGSNKIYENYEFIIPKNVSSMSLINKYSIIQVSIQKRLLTPEQKGNGSSDDIYIKLKNSNIKETDIMFKYNDEYDMKIKFYKAGVNGLFSIKDFYLIENVSEYCTGDFSKEQILLKDVYSDMIGPIKASAVNDADGDESTVGNFVGGWHGTVTNNKPSARLDALSIFADGKEITLSTGIFKCKNIRIEYINYLQGNNTTKSDGTGREILKEKVVLTITKGKIDIVDELIATEDCLLGEYYGLQTENGSAWNDNIKYFSDGIIIPKDFTSDYDCADKVNYIVCMKDKHYLSAYMKNEGLANLKYNTTTRKAHHRSYGGGKAYYDLIADTNKFTLNANNSVWWHGGYRFSYNNLILE